MKKKLNLFSVLMLISVIGIGLIMFSCTPITGGPTIPDNDTTPEITEPTDAEDPIDVEDTEDPSDTEEPTDVEEPTEPTDGEEVGEPSDTEETPGTEEPAEVAIEDYLKFMTVNLDYTGLSNMSSTFCTYHRFGGIPRATLTIETLDGQLLYESTTAYGGYGYVDEPDMWRYTFEFYSKEDSETRYTKRILTIPEKTNELKITFRYQGASQEKVIEVSVEDGTWKYIN